MYAIVKRKREPIGIEGHSSADSTPYCTYSARWSSDCCRQCLLEFSPIYQMKMRMCVFRKKAHPNQNWEMRMQESVWHKIV